MEKQLKTDYISNPSSYFSGVPVMKDCSRRPCNNCMGQEFEECQKVHTAVLEKINESIVQNYEPLDYFIKEMGSSCDRK